VRSLSPSLSLSLWGIRLRFSSAFLFFSLRGRTFSLPVAYKSSSDWLPDHSQATAVSALSAVADSWLDISSLGRMSQLRARPSKSKQSLSSSSSSSSSSSYTHPPASPPVTIPQRQRNVQAGVAEVGQKYARLA
jgi:hypothetical protein